MRHFLVAVVLCCPWLALAGESLHARDAWLRALPPGQANSAAYMTLENISERVLTITGVSTPLAQRVEIHESRQQDGMWRMQAEESLTLGPRQTAVLAPGARHLMLFGLKRAPLEGERVSFELSLQGGTVVRVSAEVRGFDAATRHDHH